MIFSSKTPRDLNRDPLPYVWNGHFPTARKRDDCRTTFRVSPDYERDPRPEFDHTQHNEPNPILSFILRDAVEQDAAENPPIIDLADTARYVLEMGLEAGEYDEAHTPEQIDHARRVLTRLANLAKLEG